MSVSRIIDEINKNLPAVGKIYGVANSIMRKRASDSVEMLPGIVDRDGEIKYVGLDDTEKVIIYHKLNSASFAIKGGRGDENDYVNTYNNSMIVFLDRKRASMDPVDLMLFLQAKFPDVVKVMPYRTIGVKWVNAIMNDQVVFASEYQNVESKLPPNKNLFQINYIIESAFGKKCFDNCP